MALTAAIYSFPFALAFNEWSRPKRILLGIGISVLSFVIIGTIVLAIAFSTGIPDC